MAGSRSRALLLVLIIIGVIILSLYFGGGGTEVIAYLQRVVLNIMSPVYSLTDRLISPVGDGWTYVVSFFNMRDENDDLRAENVDLKREVDKLFIEGEENERLRELIGFKDSSTLKQVPARVIGRSSSSWQSILIIDKGDRDDVEKNMPVVIHDGVVGKIIKVGWRTSEVLMLIDEKSGVGVEIERTGQRGIAEGRTGGGLDLNYIPKESDVVVGDVLWTSGIGLVYPRRLKVGEVVDVSEDQYSMEMKIKLKPAVNFSSIVELLIVTEPTEKDLPGKTVSSK